ncbi:MAG: hypothetical protein VYA59_06990 [Pseudomonadota bacterium]|nr:hypothetical protein [Pseudomonadota bacterium]
MALTFIILRLLEERMTGIAIDSAVTGVLAAGIYSVAAFSQLMSVVLL